MTILALVYCRDTSRQRAWAFSTPPPSNKVSKKPSQNRVKLNEGEATIAHVGARLYNLYARWSPMPLFKDCNRLFRANKITLVEWPGNSPDLNPIEENRKE